MATPSKFTKTGLIRPLLQILSRQLRPGFSQVKIYLKKKFQRLTRLYLLFLFFCFIDYSVLFLKFVSATINDIFFFILVISMLTFFLSFFLSRIWKITSELPVRSPTQMRINQDMAKGKFTLNSNFMFSFSYMRYSWHSFMNRS